MLCLEDPESQFDFKEKRIKDKTWRFTSKFMNTSQNFCGDLHIDK